MSQSLSWIRKNLTLSLVVVPAGAGISFLGNIQSLCLGKKTDQPPNGWQRDLNKWDGAVGSGLSLDYIYDISTVELTTNSTMPSGFGANIDRAIYDIPPNRQFISDDNLLKRSSFNNGPFFTWRINDLFEMYDESFDHIRTIVKHDYPLNLDTGEFGLVMYGHYYLPHIQDYLAKPSWFMFVDPGDYKTWLWVEILRHVKKTFKSTDIKNFEIEIQLFSEKLNRRIAYYNNLQQAGVKPEHTISYRKLFFDTDTDEIKRFVKVSTGEIVSDETIEQIKPEIKKYHEKNVALIQPIYDWLIKNLA